MTAPSSPRSDSEPPSKRRRLLPMPIADHLTNGSSPALGSSNEGPPHEASEAAQQVRSHTPVRNSSILDIHNSGSGKVAVTLNQSGAPAHSSAAADLALQEAKSELRERDEEIRQLKEFKEKAQAQLRRIYNLTHDVTGTASRDPSGDDEMEARSEPSNAVAASTAEDVPI
ncbi:hypothetical protein OC834_000391 [Tilletia horrida]|nr:hypothetical protein OC834_000391 [Tilletia horrida]